MEKIKLLLLAVLLDTLSGFIVYDSETNQINLNGNVTTQFSHLNTHSNLKKNNKPDEQVDQDWYNSVMKNIKKEEYNISYSEELSAYQSPNRANNFRFIYHTDGFTVKPRITEMPLFDMSDIMLEDKDKKYENIPDWKIRFSLTGYGNENVRKFEGNELQVRGNSAFVEDGNMRITYLNDEKGMRQDFIVKQKPEGNSDRLILTFRLDTKLRTKISQDEIRFYNKKNEQILQYSSLCVTDAEGKYLNAEFRKVSPGQYNIIVDDENAVYPVTIDPLSSTPDWTAESNQAGAYFGFSVSTAGDVNGDGYSDVIVGAYHYDNGQTNEGRAYVYHGSSSGLSSNANWTVESNQEGTYFGWSVSTAGDVNGDGYSNVIVGANGYDNLFTNQGRVFLYHGSAFGLSSFANWMVESNQSYSDFGSSVSTAGDVNGDGYSDVIVGAQGCSYGQSDEGSAFVYHGSALGLSATSNWTAESGQTNAYFGYSVSNAGDVNGDGFMDVIIGAYLFDNGQTDEGMVFVYHGSASGLSATSNWTAESNQANAYFGCSVSTAGDINGDGFCDVIIGAYSYDNGQTNEGMAFVYYGNEGTGLRSTLQQYKPFSTNIIGPQSLSGTYGSVRLNLFGKSPFGRGDGKLVYEIKQENQSFSGNPVTNSKSSTGSGSYIDLGTSITGVQLNQYISGIALNHEYKWRVRMQYSPVNNPYQKFGPWKYYSNYSPNPIGGFKINSMSAQSLALNLKAYLEGFWNGTEMVSDTVGVYLANSTSPYVVVDSQSVVLSTSGTASVTFTKSAPGSYYIVIKHRNHIEIWSGMPQTITAGLPLNYDFTSGQTQAYGNNLIDTYGAWCVFGGDVNQDGFVDGADMALLDNDLYNCVGGYVFTDINGDQFVNGADMAILDNNLYNYIGVIRPGGKDVLKSNNETRRQSNKDKKIKD